MIDEKKLIEELKERERTHMCDFNVFDDAPEAQFDVAHCLQELQEVMDIVRKQPKVGEWISCSELPQYTDEYNVTVGVASEFGYFEKVTTLRFERIKGEEPRWVIPDHLVCRVIAWMPLPAPCKEERGGKNE